MRQIGAVVQEAFALPDLPDCLLRGVPVSLRVIVLLPTVWAIGLSQWVDQLQGLTSSPWRWRGSQQRSPPRSHTPREQRFPFEPPVLTVA
jgi:hypothetical protein